MGFAPTLSEGCIYVGRWDDVTSYLLIYVDDILICTPDRIIMARIKAKIHEKFPIKDSGPITFFLNMHFQRNRGMKTITLHQETRIGNVLADPRLSAADKAEISKPCRIPALSNQT